MNYQSVSLHKNAGILTLTLLGPSKGNAMGPEFWDELPRAIDEISAMADVKVVIIRGSGAHFSYGLDLPRMMPNMARSIGPDTRGEQRREIIHMVRQMQSGFLKMHQSPKPYIAAIHGWCIGGGLNMISAADIRLCSADAQFSFREARLAITPDIGGLQWLPTIIGQGYTRELAFTAKDFDSAFAQKIGLINHVYATPEELFAEAQKMAEQIVQNSAMAVQGAKEVLNYGMGKDIEAGLQYVAVWNSSQLQSADFQEAIVASLEKRKPVYQ